MANFLIIGGAGYIGSHVVKELLAAGHRVVVLDNLSRGHRKAVLSDDFVLGNLGDAELLGRIFSSRLIDCVLHFAGLILVGESVRRPLEYYRNNVADTIVLLTAMRDHGVKNLVFSSSAAVYGDPDRAPIGEDAEIRPINPYGETKAFVEAILAHCERAYGLRSVSLRYFNAAGADETGSIGEDHHPETHLIPLVLQAALGKREDIKIFGTDYDTPDGTCIRDYVHVTDLTRAHILAAERLLDGGKSTAYNLGSQKGFSVREIIDIASRVTRRDIPAVESEKREGDPARLVASSEKIRSELGWKPHFDDPEKIVASAWKWHRSHPGGYGD
jgi:UDP-glucose 4-epimerase